MTEEKKPKGEETKGEATQTTTPETKAVVKAEAKPKPTPKKKLTSPAKPKEEGKAEGEATTAKEAKTEPAKEIPTKPEAFCLDQGSWDSENSFFAPDSPECKSCAEKYAECFKACQERETILKARKTEGKKRGAKKAAAPKDPSQRPQSIKIDDLIKAEMAKAEAVTTLAVEEFDKNEKLALRRIDSHIKAIKEGTYCRAEQMKPFLEAAGW